MNRMPTKILIVDDEPSLRKLMHTALYNGLREIHEAGDGDEALRLAREIEPDILVLDIGLPGTVDGLSLCETLLADSAHRKLQIIVVSGSASPQHLAKAEALNVRVFVKKPFSPVKLAALVTQMESGIHRMLVIPPAGNKDSGPGFNNPAE